MHTLTLAAAMLILLPFAIALLVGWTPSRLGTREVSRSYAYAILCLYLAVQHEGPASWSPAPERVRADVPLRSAGSGSRSLRFALVDVGDAVGVGVEVLFLVQALVDGVAAAEQYGRQDGGGD